MDSSIPLIGLGGGTLGGAWTDSGLWQAVGGHALAGAGIKVADIDSGIAFDNPCFDPTGYTYPAGFPKVDLGFERLATPKIIAARAYFRPDDPPAYVNTPADDPSDYGGGHGTHTAGTIACNYGTETTFPGATVGSKTMISGVAPKAQLMVYRVFYRATSGSNSAWDPELMRAIEDAVADGADVVNNSWGASALDTVEDDPLVKAYSAAVDAGVLVVFANGNDGPGTATAETPGVGPKFITVGASTYPARLHSDRRRHGADAGR